MNRQKVHCQTSWTGCSLDRDGCLSLQQILSSFSAPISEEHAWAVIHQALQCLSKLLDSLAQCQGANVVTSTRHIMISSEGAVQNNTFMASSGVTRRNKMVSENKTVAELGVVIFNALDFGLKEEEERQLSPALENVIDLMTSADEDDDLTGAGDTEDEGIEKDHDDEKSPSSSPVPGQSDLGGNIQKSGTCDSLIQLCRHHLALPSEADAHFRAVCRALVSEALELSSFMEKISATKNQGEDNELGELGVQDWARLWVQVIHELRSGLKLKKAEYSKTPVEFELTPYEILMDDIRSRRYKLNKVPLPMLQNQKVKKDAHDVILDFIRSRPPLKPAGERKLAAFRKQSNPVELLMESIRVEGRQSLRKTTGPPVRPPLQLSTIESSRCYIDKSWEPSPVPNKRMIQPDDDLISSLLNFSDDDDSVEEDEEKALEHNSMMKNRSEDKTDDDDRRREELRKNWQKQLALDQLLHSPRMKLERRHSVSVCQTPVKPTAPTTFSSKKTQKRISVDDGLDETDISQSSSLNSPMFSGQATPDDDPAYQINTPEMHANLHTEFLHSDQWVAALQTLELSLEEVVHIRSVLTRAELDALPLDNNLKEDVEKKRICFLCMKTKFGLFNWGCQCQMCSQQVCTRCSDKMRIPVEHFSSVPVFTLSPTSSSPAPTLSPEPKNPTGSFTSLAGLKDKFSTLAPDLSFLTSSAGSAPSSPSSRRRGGGGGRGVVAATFTPSVRPSSAGPTSLPAFMSSSQGPSTTSIATREESRKEMIMGTLLTVCTDCREMVLQVIRAQKTARRLQMTKSLFLNLRPGYTKEEIH